MLTAVIVGRPLRGICIPPHNEMVRCRMLYVFRLIMKSSALHPRYDGSPSFKEMETGLSIAASRRAYGRNSG
jgi:hypothetical protein